MIVFLSAAVVVRQSVGLTAYNRAGNLIDATTCLILLAGYVGTDGGVYHDTNLQGWAKLGLTAKSRVSLLALPVTSTTVYQKYQVKADKQ